MPDVALVGSVNVQTRLDASGSWTCTHASTAFGALELIVIDCVAQTGAGTNFPTIGTPSGGGLTWTAVTAQVNGTAGKTASTRSFWAYNTSAQTFAPTYSVTYAGGGALSGRSIMRRWSDASSSAPIGATDSHSGQTDPLTSNSSLELANVLDGSVLCVAAIDWAALTPPACSFDNSLADTEDLASQESAIASYYFFRTSSALTSGLSQVRAQIDVTGTAEWAAVAYEIRSGTPPTDPYVTQHKGGATSVSPSITFDTAPAENDIVAMWVTGTAATFSGFSVPTGWTNALATASSVQASDSHIMCCVYHRVTAGEAAANTVTFTATNLFTANPGGYIEACVVRNVDTTTATDARNSTFSSTNTATPHVLASNTLTADGAGALTTSCVAKDATPGTWTTPANWALIRADATNVPMWLGHRVALGTASESIAATNITPSAGDEYVSITISWRKAVTSTDLTVTARVVVGAVAHASATVTADGSTRVLVGVRPDAAATAAVDAASRVVAGVIVRGLVASGDLTATATVVVGARVGADATITADGSSRVLVGVIARAADAVAEWATSTRVVVGARVGATATAAVDAASRVIVGARPGATATTTFDGSSRVVVGTTVTAPASASIPATSRVVVGAAVSAGISAVTDLVAVARVVVGAIARGIAAPEMAGSGRVVVGVVPRAVASTEMPRDALVAVGAVTRAGAATITADGSSRVLVGVRAAASPATITADGSSRVTVGAQVAGVAAAELAVAARILVGVIVRALRKIAPTHVKVLGPYRDRPGSDRYRDTVEYYYREGPR
jgi:hypothetical protein